jgi:hypothetical protein
VPIQYTGTQRRGHQGEFTYRSAPSQAAIGLRLLRHAGQTSETDKHGIASNALTYVNDRNQ